ncbi:hypothetical protein K492DRAFT_207032 [Lichtheimia hyalospora FSU 10163]|nr:hypothetical protein K492DRAFT_207032 [Lichtheimia hyalospora FSU 10163]
MSPEVLGNDTTLYPGIFRPPTDPIMLGNHWRESVTGDHHGNSTTMSSGRSSSNNKVTDVPWSTSNSNNGNRNNGPTMMDHSSPVHTSSPPTKYDWRMQSLMLCRHIMTRGLVDGIGSDIAVHVPAWGKIYHLHRLILDQNPYFSMLLQGGFREATSDSVTLHFENSPYITKESFYFVLQQLYGKLTDPNIHHDNVRQILATCSFFQLEHMCELCIDFILRTMNESNVIVYLAFADNHLVHGSDRILNAVFTFLCREAYSMDMDRVADIPITWIKKVIESDAFWVPTEYDRYRFAYRVLMQHYQMQHYNNSVTTSSVDLEDAASNDEHQKRSSFAPSPVSATPSTPSTIADTPSSSSDEEEDVIVVDIDDEAQDTLNKDLDVFLVIFTQLLHYVHMTFEQLEQIRSDTNPFTGEPLVPDSILKDALWQQIRMRSKIEGSTELDTTLGLTVSEKDANKSQKKAFLTIPTDDTTIYTGGSSSPSTTHQDSKRRKTPISSNNETECKKKEEKSYSLYPPFRFSVEFADFATLKYNVRVYSKTIFYAGSNWNMYIQKARSQRKGVPQLGVYLHRQSVPCSQGGESRICTPGLSPFSCFADKRKVVRTWFKIYCPARGPKHTLTLFQSSPDNFSVLQSWGWRSTTLCADEALSSGINAAAADTGALLTTDNTTHLTDIHPSTDEPPIATTFIPATTNSNLRFSIVMGHV